MSLELISTTLRLVSNLPANNWLIYRLPAQCMISKSNVKRVPFDDLFVVIFFKSVNKTVNRLGFCDIRKNQLKVLPAELNTCLDLDYSGYHQNLIQWLFRTWCINYNCLTIWMISWLIDRQKVCLSARVADRMTEWLDWLTYALTTGPWAPGLPGVPGGPLVP